MIKISFRHCYIDTDEVDTVAYPLGFRINGVPLYV